jgi:hypothetical protein
MHRNFLPGSLIVLFSLVIPFAAMCQQTTTQGIYWIRYQNQIYFSPDFYWSNEVDNRRFFSGNVQTQSIFHSRVHYKNKRWDYAAGLTLSWAYAQYAEEPVEHATVEVRPVAEVSYEVPIRKIYIQNRLRIDNRFFEENKAESVFDGTEYTARFRYRLQARMPLVSDDAGTKVGVKVAEEIMLNHRENVFDQNRIYVTGEYYASKKIAIEAGYVYIYQQRFAADDFFERHVVRFSLIHKIFQY